MPETQLGVVIVGAGPAGLSAARALAAHGISNVVVLERNDEPGGLPRFCRHIGWGIRDLRRCYTGPGYARALTQRATARIETNVSVLRLLPGGGVEISTPSGPSMLAARAILLATGIRETPRGARLIGGVRPWGVTTTGAFQEMVYAGRMAPFRRPVIIGTELVAFSALLTARHAGIRPVAMIEAGERITARHPADLCARALFGVPVMTATTLLEINGSSRVESIDVEHGGRRSTIACDGVIFTGHFLPESHSAKISGLTLDPGTGGPAIDHFHRCSDPVVFAAGNMLRPVEHSGIAALEGIAAGAAIARALTQGLPAPETGLPVQAAGALRYIYPQTVYPESGRVRLFGRAAAAHQGTLRVVIDGRTIARRAVSTLPERRITVALDTLALAGARAIQVVLD